VRVFVPSTFPPDLAEFVHIVPSIGELGRPLKANVGGEGGRAFDDGTTLIPPFATTNAHRDRAMVALARANRVRPEGVRHGVSSKPPTRRRFRAAL
jgi:hypothetical protein